MKLCTPVLISIRDPIHLLPDPNAATWRRFDESLSAVIYGKGVKHSFSNTGLPASLRHVIEYIISSTFRRQRLVFM
jgi:hypothetical protein